MTQALIGSLRVDLGMRTAAFEKGITDVQKRLKGVERNLKRTARKFQNAGRTMTIGLTAPLATLGVTATNAAIKYREAAAQVEQGLKTMGDASGKNLGQLKADAEALEKTSLFSRQDILQTVTANMLTFGNVSGDAFDRAQQAALDLSQRLGQDLKSSTIQIGKALNDPIRGVTALSRVGVQFTDDQRNMIKAMVEAGDVAGAQSMILSELEKQYAGSAQAAQDAAPGDEIQDAWNQFQLTLGEIIVKVLPPLTDALAKVIDKFNNLSPGMQKAIVVGGALVAAMGPLVAAFGSLIVPVGTLIAKISILIGAGGLPAVGAALAAWAAPFAVATGAVMALVAAFKILSPLIGSARKAASLLMEVERGGVGIRQSLAGATLQNADATRKSALAYIDEAKAAIAATQAARERQLEGARFAKALGTVPGAQAAYFKLMQAATESAAAINKTQEQILAVERGIAGMQDRLDLKPIEIEIKPIVSAPAPTGSIATTATQEAVSQSSASAARSAAKNTPADDINNALQESIDLVPIAQFELATLREGVELTGDAMQNAFQRGADAFTGLINAIKSGDIGSILEQGIGFLSQLFGKGGQSRGAGGSLGGIGQAFSQFAGMFDAGGKIPTGKWGIAGEYGPEIVRGPASVTSRAATARMMGGMTRAGSSMPPIRIAVEANDYFDAKVVGTSAQVTDARAPAHAQSTVARASRAAAKSSGRRITP